MTNESRNYREVVINTSFIPHYGLYGLVPAIKALFHGERIGSLYDFFSGSVSLKNTRSYLKEIGISDGDEVLIRVITTNANHFSTALHSLDIPFLRPDDLEELRKRYEANVTIIYALGILRVYPSGITIERKNRSSHLITGKEAVYLSNSSTET